jgi:hypothetical protein
LISQRQFRTPVPQSSCASAGTFGKQEIRGWSSPRDYLSPPVVQARKAERDKGKLIRRDQAEFADIPLRGHMKIFDGSKPPSLRLIGTA